MQKTYLYPFVIIFTALFLGGCTLLPTKQKSLDNTTNIVGQEGNQDNAQANSDVINPTGQYTINELLTMKKPMKCTWKDSMQGDKDVTNIIYINKDKFYQDVTMSDIGHSYTISDGEYLYIWNDFNEMASKIKNTEEMTNLNQGKPQANPTSEQKRDFVCNKWTADNSIFIPPQDKNFVDVTTEVTEGFKELGNGGLEKMKQQACDQCQKAPTMELKNECLVNAECF